MSHLFGVILITVHVQLPLLETEHLTLVHLEKGNKIQ